MKGLTGGFIGGLNIRENLIQQELLSYLSTSIDSVKAKPKLWFTFLIVCPTINVSVFLTECLILLILPNWKPNFY